MYRNILFLLFVLVVALPSVSDAGPFRRRSTPQPSPSVYGSSNRVVWPTSTYTFENMDCRQGMKCVGGTFDFGNGNDCQWRFAFNGNANMRLSIISSEGAVSTLTTSYRVGNARLGERVNVTIPCLPDPQESITFDWDILENRAYNARMQSS